MRHGRGHFLIDRHLFFNGSLHSHQSNPELVLQQLTNGPDTTVAQVVDIVHVAYILPELKKVTNHRIKIFRFKSSLFQRRIKVEFDVEFETTHAREIIFPWIKKHAFKKISRRFQRWRIAWTQLAIDLNQSLLSGFDAIFFHGLAYNHSHIVTFRVEDGKFSDPGIEHGSDGVGFYFLIGF